jgi:hypothetical protein
MSDSHSAYKGTPLRTPHQSRPYLANNFAYHQTPMPDHIEGILEADEMRNEGDQIYGTTISLTHVLLQIEKFILEFQ